MSKTIAEFELVDHGIDYPDYFQGCGVSFTQFEHVATGCGNNPAEAIDDALEQLAQSDWDVDDMDGRILADLGVDALPETPSVPEDAEEAYYYVSIRVRGDESQDETEEPSEPEEDDYTTSDHVNWYQNGKLVLTTPEQDYKAVKAHMDAEQFWPNAWFISDHGNAHLINLAE